MIQFYSLLIVMIIAVGKPPPIISAGVKHNYNSHLMLEFDFDVTKPSSIIRKYPHEKWCQYYYKWESEDMYTVRQCPGEEIFDYRSHECQKKTVAMCWADLYGKTVVHDKIHSNWRKHFRCPFSTGKYPDVFDCEKYFKCEEGKAQHKHCPKYKMFDRILRRCVSDDVTLCADSTDAVDIDHRCPKSSGNFGHPKDCSKYYKCHRGEPNLKKCQVYTLFHEMKRKCVNMKHVRCGHRHNPYENETFAKEISAEGRPILETYDQLKESIKTSHSNEENEVDIILVDDTTKVLRKGKHNPKSNMLEKSGYTIKNIETTPKQSAEINSKEQKVQLKSDTQNPNTNISEEGSQQTTQITVDSSPNTEENEKSTINPPKETSQQDLRSTSELTNDTSRAEKYATTPEITIITTSQ